MSMKGTDTSGLVARKKVEGVQSKSVPPPNAPTWAVKQSKSFLFRQHVLTIFCLGSEEVPSQVDSVELVHQVTKSSYLYQPSLSFSFCNRKMKTSDTFQEYISLL